MLLEIFYANSKQFINNKKVRMTFVDKKSRNPALKASTADFVCNLQENIILDNEILEKIIQNLGPNPDQLIIPTDYKILPLKKNWPIPKLGSYYTSIDRDRDRDIFFESRIETVAFLIESFELQSINLIKQIATFKLSTYSEKISKEEIKFYEESLIYSLNEFLELNIRSTHPKIRSLNLKTMFKNYIDFIISEYDYYSIIDKKNLLEIWKALLYYNISFLNDLNLESVEKMEKYLE